WTKLDVLFAAALRRLVDLWMSPQWKKDDRFKFTAGAAVEQLGQISTNVTLPSTAQPIPAFTWRGALSVRQVQAVRSWIDGSLFRNAFQDLLTQAGSFASTAVTINPADVPLELPLPLAAHLVFATGNAAVRWSNLVVDNAAADALTALAA